LVKILPGALSVISPLPVPPLLTVVIVVFPARRCAIKVSISICDAAREESSAQSSTVQRVSSVPASLMVMSVGSISNNPALPLGALLSIMPLTSTYFCPLNSTKPPLPELSPPLTAICAVGAINALSGEKTTTLPPLPFTPAFAVVALCGPNATVLAARNSTLPPSPAPRPSAFTLPN